MYSWHPFLGECWGTTVDLLCLPLAGWLAHCGLVVGVWFRDDVQCPALCAPSAFPFYTVQRLCAILLVSSSTLCGVFSRSTAHLILNHRRFYHFFPISKTGTVKYTLCSITGVLRVFTPGNTGACVRVALSALFLPLSRIE